MSQLARKIGGGRRQFRRNDNVAIKEEGGTIIQEKGGWDTIMARKKGGGMREFRRNGGDGAIKKEDGAIIQEEGGWAATMTRSRRYRHLFPIILGSFCFVLSLRLVGTQNRRLTSLLSVSILQQKQNKNPRIVEVLPLNPNATLASDVLAIHHVVQKSQVIVYIKQDAICFRPYLVGRMSGPALVELEWSWNPASTNNTTAMVGTYLAPEEGEYFLEIAAMYCNDFFYNLKDVDKRNDDDWVTHASTREVMAFNFQGVCMEDPSHQHLTAYYATIFVEHQQSSLIPGSEMQSDNSTHQTHHQLKGFWYNSDGSKPSDPVYTRYQPFQCFIAHKARHRMPRECIGPTSLQRFDSYQFKWMDPALTGLNVATLHQDSPTVICVVGASHSRTLWEASERLGMHLDNVNVTVEWLQVQYPAHVSVGLVNRYIKEKKCNKLVIAVGQWPASYVRGVPTLLHEYYFQLKTMFQNLLGSVAITRQVEIYARSIHYNPLTYMMITCPPKEWRSPIVIDGYNKIIAAVCHQLNIPYLDTNFLVSPVWDSSPDWCHLGNKTSDQEMLYIAASVLGYPRRAKSTQTYSSLATSKSYSF